MSNHGPVWELDHKLNLGDATDIAEKLERCAGMNQRPLVNRLHKEKSNAEIRRKSQAMIDAEQTTLTTLADEAREHVESSQRLWGAEAPKTMDRLKDLGDALLKAQLHAEALVVEEGLRNIRISRLGWDDPKTLDSCTRVAIILAALGRNADAMAILSPALGAHIRLYGPEHHRTLEVVVLMVESLGALGDDSQVEQLLLRKSDAEMADRVRARQASKVRRRSGLVSALAN